MANYLTKEDIKKWRSSLERITLEQYAQKLGKEIPEEKETFDIVDIVLEHNNNHLSDDIDMSYTGEKISVFAKSLIEISGPDDKFRSDRPETGS